MHCLTCHYNLRNLVEHRCPECGRAFDPSDPKTFNPFFPYIPTLSRYLTAIVITVVFFVIIGLLSFAL